MWTKAGSVDKLVQQYYFNLLGVVSFLSLNVLVMYVVTPCTSRSADVKGKNIDAVNSVLKHRAHITQVNDEAWIICYQGEARYYGLNRRSSCRL